MFYKERRKVRKTIRRCRKAMMVLGKYDEYLPDAGIAESMIFCTCCALMFEKSSKVMDMVLFGVIKLLSTDPILNQDEKTISRHVAENTTYYRDYLTDVVNHPAHFDLKPLYCAFYRYPMTDVHLAVIEPKDPLAFRNVIISMIYIAIGLKLQFMGD